MSEVAAISFINDPWIRVSPKLALNDPFECTPSDDTKRAIAERFKGFSSLSEYQQNFIIHDFEGVMDYFGVVSLTKRRNDTLMWSHYAESHKGVVFESDLNDVIEGIAINSDIIYGNVKYLGSRIYLGGYNSLKEVRKHYFFTKSEPWAYEFEFRLVIPINLNMKISFDLKSESSIEDMRKLGFDCSLYKLSKERFTPKLFLTHLNDINILAEVWLNSNSTNTQFYFYIGHEAVRRVFIGANANVEKFKEVLADVDSLRIYRSQLTGRFNDVFTMSVDKNTFKLNESEL
ncbi:DUF2971 domain-containing protein [Shewanella sp. 1180_01]|uniref:DUF2971 domain-containing protein n=1 Tax=Shewanella sp. 1180_01 TaxID=2604451 RepID=UPI004062BB19